jgi:DNA end-binding protein Ku
LPKRAEKKSRPADELLDDNTPRARPFWSGTISFGLVTIPVDLFAATRTTRTSLRMLAPSGSPVARRYFNEAGKLLDGGQIERGYELERDEYVVVTDDELEALAPDQSRDIDLSRFVPRDEIPTAFFDRVYILAPAGNSNVAYRLLAQTLEDTKRAGIARFVMRGKQHAVAIVAEGGVLRAETLRFADELRTPKDLDLPEPTKPSAAKLKAMRGVITRAEKSSLPTRELADTYWKRLEALVAKKHKRGDDVVAPETIDEPQENLAEVIDLVAVLQRSLGQGAGADSKAKAAPAKPSRAATKSAPKKAATTKAAASKRAKPRAARGR